MITAPRADVRPAAEERLASLAIPAGALGRLGDLGVWWSTVTGQVPPPRLEQVSAVVFAGDHGVTQHGVSAYPAAITPAMVRSMHGGTAGVAVLARQHGVDLRVLDVAVDVPDFDDLDPAISARKIHRGARPLHLEDALTAAELEQSLALGADVAREEIARGAQLLISGDMGIGNTTPAAALIAATLGLPAAEVVGRGTGVDDEGLVRKTALLDQALTRTRHLDDPRSLLAALGSADIAATAGYLAAAAEAGVPMLLDGLISVAAGLLADRIAPGAAAWFAAGHRSTEPAQSLALEKLGLEPLLDLGMRLGEGSGAVAAVPLLKSAALLMNELALLSDL